MAGEGERAGAGGTVPLLTLHWGRETAPGREGQAGASVRSHLNLCSQCWLQGAILFPPETRQCVPIRRWVHPSRDQARDHMLTAELGRQEGAVKITSLLRGLILLPFVSTEPRGR